MKKFRFELTEVLNFLLRSAETNKQLFHVKNKRDQFGNINDLAIKFYYQ